MSLPLTNSECLLHALQTMPTVREAEMYHPVHQSKDIKQLEPDSRETRRSWKRLGTYNACALIFGTLAILVAISFLAFLWSGANKSMQGSRPQQLWLKILENDGMTITVTVCSVLIRVAIAAPMGVFAAMIAAVIIERIGVRSVHFPLVYIIRSNNTGPSSLFQISDRGVLGHTLRTLLSLHLRS